MGERERREYLELVLSFVRDGIESRRNWGEKITRDDLINDIIEAELFYLHYFEDILTDEDNEYLDNALSIEEVAKRLNIDIEE